MAKKTFECFGGFSISGSRCASCRYRESCALYTETEGLVHSLSGLPSFDTGMDEWVPDVRTLPESDPEREEAGNEFRDQLASMLRYLLSLDPYTLGIIADIIVPENSGEANDGGISVSQLALHRNCSRQAIHRKLLAVAYRHPELGSLLQTTLRKLGGIKSRFRRNRGTGNVDEQNV